MLYLYAFITIRNGSLVGSWYKK